MIPDIAERLLAKGLEGLKLEINEVQRSQLLQYLSVLTQWNKTFNLTAIRDYNDMVVHHLLDSFAIQPFVLEHSHGDTAELGLFQGKGGSCLDIGSGAGVPGIPLAILNPHLQWTLIDSNGKKARFLRHVVRDAALQNVTVFQGRIEALELEANAQRPLLVTARALASTEEIVQLVRHFLVPGDRLLLMKGTKGSEEAEQEYNGFQKFQVHQIKVPFLDAERCVLTAQVIES